MATVIAGITMSLGWIAHRTHVRAGLGDVCERLAYLVFGGPWAVIESPFATQLRFSAGLGDQSAGGQSRGERLQRAVVPHVLAR